MSLKQVKNNWQSSKTDKEVPKPQENEKLMLSYSWLVTCEMSFRYLCLVSFFFPMDNWPDQKIHQQGPKFVFKVTNGTGTMTFHDLYQSLFGSNTSD